MSAAGEVSSSEKALMIVANEGYVSYALLALVIYELAVTFDQEVALVWSRRFTATSFLLLSTRWTTLLIAAIQAWNAGPHFCELSEDLVIVMYMISCLWMTGFTSLRLYALLHASKARSSLALVVATLGLIPVATNAFLLAESTCQGGGSVFRRTCTRSTDIPNKTYVIVATYAMQRARGRSHRHRYNVEKIVRTLSRHAEAEIWRRSEGLDKRWHHVFPNGPAVEHPSGPGRPSMCESWGALSNSCAAMPASAAGTALHA
ncbi:hypothetical protein PsYK624_145530 [Phanerochaete sordida]|uniref:DUF6533 domain-containing protein n=1 Tax=Phanerochaete sordida TaxID=48140 RepID=A0A9P3GRU5_9APHY|nr:hypothetical protein PsYK624_145530 [Phanerochaete sordida]